MKHVFTIVFSLSVFTSYSQLEFYECPISSRKEFVRDAKLRLDTVFSGKDTAFYGWGIDKGNSVVFKYEYFYSCDKTNHLGVVATLTWSIPNDKTSFSIDFNNIDSLKGSLIYKTGCGPPCKWYNFDLIAASGNIQGKLGDKKWAVNGNLKLILKNRSRNIVVPKEISINDEFVLWVQKRKDRKGHKFNGF